VLAVITAHIFNKTIFKAKEAPFVMELPPYRIPSLKSTLKHMWDKSVQYIQKVGGIILIAVVIIWVLGYFPQDREYADGKRDEISALKQQLADSITDDTVFIEKSIADIEMQINNKQLENSYLGDIGHFVEPIIKPLGFDWRMGIALLSGVAAKEVVVSTIGVIVQADSGSDDDVIRKLRTMKYDSGENIGVVIFTPLIALGFLIFVLIYSPCIGVIGAIAKESGSWKWSFLMIGYTTLLAWLLAFILHQVGALFM
jgi:ferrous iron transport protein B